MLNPEAYLYRAIIVILDGRTQRRDFLRESAPLAGEREAWKNEEDDHLVQETQAFERLLQTVNPPDNSYAIVAAYRNASKALLL